MKRLALFLFILLPWAALAQDNDLAREVAMLNDCSSHLGDSSIFYDTGLRLVRPEKDLAFVVDGNEGALYVFTPYFAGKADLSHDKDGRKIEVMEAYNTHTYNIRIPYVPGLPQSLFKPSGYYYFTLHDMPFGGRHDTRLNFPPRFIPGTAQKLPDFTRHPATNGTITITSATGVANNGVEFHPLAIEDRLWDSKAKDNFSPEARNVLVSTIAARIDTMGPEHKVGDGSGCEGHLGCDWKYTEDMVAREHAAREATLATCKAAADAFHLELFPPASPPAAKPVTLAMRTEPEGAHCRCNAERYWGYSIPHDRDADIFLPGDTPAHLSLPGGVYRSVTCDCTRENGNDSCQRASFRFTGHLGGKIVQDEEKRWNMADPATGAMMTNSCSILKADWCEKDSDCVQVGSGSYCFWKNSRLPGPINAKLSQNCQCVKEQCRAKPVR